MALLGHQGSAWKVLGEVIFTGASSETLSCVLGVPPSPAPGSVCFISPGCVDGVFGRGCSLCAFCRAIGVTVPCPPGYSTGEYPPLKCNLRAWKQDGVFVAGSVTGVMPGVPWAQGRTAFTRLCVLMCGEAWRCCRAAKVGGEVAEQTT